MIQRIQTLFLFTAFAAIVSLIFLPVAQFIDYSGNMHSLGFYGLINETDLTNVATTWMSLVYPYLILSISLGILVIVFYYKKRTLQIKLCFVGMLIMVLLVAFNYMMFGKIRENEMWRVGVFTMYSYMPFVATFFLFFAKKAIQKDEDLVKSVDRLR